MDTRCPVHPEQPADGCRECEIDVAVTDPKLARRIPLRELVERFKKEAEDNT